MQISSARLGDGLILRVEEPRIDAVVAIQFKESMRQATAQPGSPVILDMENVGFLDSSGLGALVAVMKLLGEERPLHLAALRPAVARVLRLTRMDSVFTLHDTVPGRVANPQDV